MHMLRWWRDAELLMLWAGPSDREVERRTGHHKDRQAAAASPVFTLS